MSSCQCCENPTPNSPEWVKLVAEKVYQLWLRDLRLEKERARLTMIKRK